MTEADDRIYTTISLDEWLALRVERDALKARAEGLRRACAEVVGADPETWPDHGNAELAIAACLALRTNEIKTLEAERDALHELAAFAVDERDALRKRVAELETSLHEARMAAPL